MAEDVLSDKARDQSVDRKVHWAAVANIERLCEKSVSLWNKKSRNGSEEVDHYAKHGCPFVLGGVTYVAKITLKAYPAEDSLATYSVEAISVEKNWYCRIVGEGNR